MLAAEIDKTQIVDGIASTGGNIATGKILLQCIHRDLAGPAVIPAKQHSILYQYKGVASCQASFAALRTLAIANDVKTALRH